MKPFPIREIKPAPSEPKISQTFRIRDVAILLGGKDMLQDTHRHNFFFVLALKDGAGTHVIDFTPYKIKNNCIFIMRPGQVHQLQLLAGSTGYLMEFNMEFYHVNDRGTGHVLRQATTSNYCDFPAAGFEKLNAILQSIYQEYTDAKDGYQEVIRAQLDIFFIEWVRNRRQSDKSQARGNAYEQERLEEFQVLIEKYVSSRKPISEFADMLNLSTYQLSAITKGLLGKTPSELVTEYVVLEAKRHLLASSDQVNQIGWHLGFEDPSYFIRFFRKHTGLSPEAFRSNSK